MSEFTLNNTNIFDENSELQLITRRVAKVTLLKVNLRINKNNL